MRLRSISVRNALPVRYFAVDNLSDLIVLAGPNGVGKTRLLQRIMDYLRGAVPNPDVKGQIEATSAEERKSWGGRTTLDMESAEDMALFRTTLQVNRRRRNLRSNLVNIESDRTIQQLQPLAFAWDMPDPEDEDIQWDVTFGGMRNRFQDTVHSMFRMIEAQKQKIANRALELRRQGKNQMSLRFGDPMEPFKAVFTLLLAPKELVDPSVRDQRLSYRMDDAVYDFASLSSGEREVVNIAFDFLLRRPQDSIIFFDEPELHLHPELSYRLIQTLQQIGSNNQFVLSTHSPDVISASLDRSVIFLSPAADTQDEEPYNQAITVTEADETNKALKLLGQSIGIIALGRRIVLIEGEQSSIDKQTYGSILRNRWPGLVLVPSGGKHVIESFSAVYEAVLSKSIWGVEFFMLCDGDSIPAASPEQAKAAQTGGRLRILSRYHLENYFLDEHVWSRAFSLLELEGSWLRRPSDIRQRLRDSARQLVSYATALAVASKLRLHVGNLDIMPKDCHGKTLDEVKGLILSELSEDKLRIDNLLTESTVGASTIDYFNRLTKSLDDDTDEWKALIPGKPLLGRFASAAGINASRAKTMYINAAQDSGRQPFAEILDIFEHFAEAKW